MSQIQDDASDLEAKASAYADALADAPRESGTVKWNRGSRPGPRPSAAAFIPTMKEHTDVRETDFEPDWSRYQRLALLFVAAPGVNTTEIRDISRQERLEELRDLLREARADAVRFVQDIKSEELKKAFEDGRAASR